MVYYGVDGMLSNKILIVFSLVAFISSIVSLFFGLTTKNGQKRKCNINSLKILENLFFFFSIAGAIYAI